MPRKTKKQKVIAAYRRKFLARVPEKIETKLEIKKHIVSTSSSPSHGVPASFSSVFHQNRAVIVGDLRKTVAFSLIAIVLEFVLYFVTSS